MEEDSFREKVIRKKKKVLIRFSLITKVIPRHCIHKKRLFFRTTSKESYRVYQSLFCIPHFPLDLLINHLMSPSSLLSIRRSPICILLTINVSAREPTNFPSPSVASNLQSHANAPANNRLCAHLSVFHSNRCNRSTASSFCVFL